MYHVLWRSVKIRNWSDRKLKRTIRSHIHSVQEREYRTGVSLYQNNADWFIKCIKIYYQEELIWQRFFFLSDLVTHNMITLIKNEHIGVTN